MTLEMGFLIFKLPSLKNTSINFHSEKPQKKYNKVKERFMVKNQK